MALVRRKKKIGVRVGRTESTRTERVMKRHKGTRVTMGFGIPRQADGVVGDITVNKTSQGLRCYIKTNSGWFDINTMQSAAITEWIPMILAGSWATDADYGEASYFRDERGFVYLRGGVDSGTSYNATIATLPVGFRPRYTTNRIALATELKEITMIRITTGGVINMPFHYTLELGAGPGGDEIVANTSLKEVYLDGISFFAGQKVKGQGGGSTGGGGGGASHGGGGA